MCTENINILCSNKISFRLIIVWIHVSKNTHTHTHLPQDKVENGIIKTAKLPLPTLSVT